MWLLLTQRGALGGAPELSGGGKPHPTCCHSLGPVSCLCGQERLGTGRAQPSSPSGIPHSVLPETIGRTCTRDMGGNRQPHGRNTRWSQGFIDFKWSTSQFFISHSTLGGLKLFLCPSRLHGTEVLQEVTRQTGCPSAGALWALQWCWDMSRTYMSDPTNTPDCWIIPLNPTQQLWGVQREDEEIKHAINVWGIKLNYL